MADIALLQSRCLCNRLGGITLTTPLLAVTYPRYLIFGPVRNLVTAHNASINESLLGSLTVPSSLPALLQSLLLFLVKAHGACPLL
jgi:hypothetical protein